MKERPILFSGPMVRAILDGTKTQTRRVVKPQPTTPRGDAIGNKNVLLFKWHNKVDTVMHMNIGPECLVKFCPYGQPGDRLWVRETFAYGGVREGHDVGVVYAADDSGVPYDVWKPSIFMPRKLSRITLEVTDVRVHELHRIGELSAKAEGVEPRRITSTRDYESYDSYSAPFADLWDAINARRGYGWDTNPWVWAISFKQVEQC